MSPAIRRAVRGLLEVAGLLTFARSVLGRRPDGTPKGSVASYPKPAETTSAGSVPDATAESEYQRKLDAERATFRDQVDVHALPEIFHYWSNKYLLPKFQPFGFASPDDFFVLHIKPILDSASAQFTRIASIGAGNCDTEIRLARALRQHGHEHFCIDCLDLNDDMLQRGARDAALNGLSAQIRAKCVDLNRWKPSERYSVVIANQSLHHIAELEKVFANIKEAMEDNGLFLTSDMIGRNGHMRWPEAKRLVDSLWTELPERYRYNHQLKRVEHDFLDWDCSTEGFEGVRAQDVLPLLIQHFHFESFFAFANIIDVFIDRGFGHNFSVSNPWDRAFIDRVHAVDESALQAGTIKPTHILAAMRKTPVELRRYAAPFTPAFAVRDVAPGH